MNGPFRAAYDAPISVEAASGVVRRSRGLLALLSTLCLFAVG
jgi:hypothetical protein